MSDKTINKKFFSASSMATIAIMTAVLCILSPIAIPIGPVPISLGSFAVSLTVYILGSKKGTIAVSLYILIGLIGLPVFSGFSGGFTKLAGPTGGYILAYIPAAFIAGFIIERNYKHPILGFLALNLGSLILYTIGTAWLANSLSLTFTAALLVGVVPFIVVDIIKCVGATILGTAIHRALIKANIL